MRLFAIIHNARAMRLEESGDEAGAIEAYGRAACSDRRWSAPWFNLGLLHKRRGRWEESFRDNEQAVALNPASEGAWWNLGIAATALGRWQRAREAWRACGIDVPDGDEPPEMDFGLTPIRLRSNEEVVWCRRIDPARAIVMNVPLPESGHRYGDLLLHDGARNGTRLLDGVEVGVFDELARLQPSRFETFVVDVSGISAARAEELLTAARAAGLEGEDWTANIAPLCQSCSDGHVDHVHESVQDSPPRTIAFAAESEDAVHQLLAAFPDVEVTLRD